MDKDIVPELLELLNKEFGNDLRKSTIIQKSIQTMRNHTATYKDVNEYSIEVGKILARLLDKNINAEMLPDGKMYFNIADRLMNNLLKENHELITGYASDVQTQMNRAAGYRLKGQIPDFNKDRVAGIVNRLSSETDFEQIKWLLNEPIITFSQSIVDDAIEKNVEFHHNAGLQPHITRTVVGKSCDWCRNLAGSYDYAEKPDDIYRRHERCRCIVEYKPVKGNSKNVWTKKNVRYDRPKNISKVSETSYVSDKRNWQKKYNKKSIAVEDRDYWIDNGNKYVVNGKSVTLDYSKNEKQVAKFMSKNLGAKVEMVPRVSYPQNIKTPDYLIKGVSFDLKQIMGNGKNVLDGMLKKNQSHNFIVDIAGTSLNQEEVLRQINRIYSNPHRSWLDTIILINSSQLIDIFVRK